MRLSATRSMVDGVLMSPDCVCRKSAGNGGERKGGCAPTRIPSLNGRLRLRPRPGGGCPAIALRNRRRDLSSCPSAGNPNTSREELRPLASSTSLPHLSHTEMGFYLPWRKFLSECRANYSASRASNTQNRSRPEQRLFL